MDFGKIYAIFSLVLLVVFRLIAKWVKMKDLTVLLITATIGLQYSLVMTLYSISVYQSSKFEWLPIPVLLIFCVVEFIRIKKKTRVDEKPLKKDNKTGDDSLS